MKDAIAQGVAVAVMVGVLLSGVSWLLAPVHDAVSDIRSELHDLVERVASLEANVALLLVRFPVPGGQPAVSEVPQQISLEASPPTCASVRWRADGGPWSTWGVPCAARTWDAAPAPWRGHGDENTDHDVEWLSGRACVWTSADERQANDGIGASGRDMERAGDRANIKAAWRELTWIGGGRDCSGYAVDPCIETWKGEFC